MLKCKQPVWDWGEALWRVVEECSLRSAQGLTQRVENCSPQLFISLLRAYYFLKKSLHHNADSAKQGPCLPAGSPRPPGKGGAGRASPHLGPISGQDSPEQWSLQVWKIPSGTGREGGFICGCSPLETRKPLFYRDLWGFLPGRRWAAGGQGWVLSFSVP